MDPVLALRPTAPHEIFNAQLHPKQEEEQPLSPEEVATSLTQKWIASRDTNMVDASIKSMPASSSENTSEAIAASIADNFIASRKEIEEPSESSPVIPMKSEDYIETLVARIRDLAEDRTRAPEQYLNHVEGLFRQMQVLLLFVNKQDTNATVRRFEEESILNNEKRRQSREASVLETACQIAVISTAALSLAGGIFGGHLFNAACGFDKHVNILGMADRFPGAKGPSHFSQWIGSMLGHVSQAGQMGNTLVRTSKEAYMTETDGKSSLLQAELQNKNSDKSTSEQLTQSSLRKIEEAEQVRSRAFSDVSR